MRLPEGLLAAIQREVKDVDRKRLARAAAELTRCYRSADFSAPPIRTQEDRAAYLTVRLPATYAANWRVFSEIRQLASGVEIGSVLDLATGPGTALFAAAEVFPTLRQATLYDSDAAWLDVHFEDNRSKYEAQGRAGSIQHGWHVLDAGCGADLVTGGYSFRSSF